MNIMNGLLKRFFIHLFSERIQESMRCNAILLTSFVCENEKVSRKKIKRKCVKLCYDIVIVTIRSNKRALQLYCHLRLENSFLLLLFLWQ